MGIAMNAMKRFRKGLKSGGSKTELDGQTMATDENRPSGGGNGGDNYDIHQRESTSQSRPSCVGGESHGGRPPRPTRRSAKE